MYLKYTFCGNPIFVLNTTNHQTMLASSPTQNLEQQNGLMTRVEEIIKSYFLGY